MVKLNSKQVAEIKQLNEVTVELLEQALPGKTDPTVPVQITNPQASCLISRAVANVVKILSIINEAEK